MTHQEEIPVWSYINFQLLYQVHNAQQNQNLESMTIADILKKTSEHIGINKPLTEFYTPINSGTIFSFLYSLLVVPKEIFKNDNDFFSDFDFTVTDFFNIEFGSEIIQQKQNLFRILRNAISHVNYRIDDNNKYTVVLWNENRSGKKDIQLHSDINRLSNFAVKLAKYYNTKIK